jgi:2-C-methyl-D-erythritol 4-phosphate cytidylyltransferase / 2-C-methyl-D-erythritol 2,4-cyclodiphosphate synthase
MTIDPRTPFCKGRLGSAAARDYGPAMRDCIALVVAAGRGTRFGADTPKQYAVLAGRPVLRHALEAFAAHDGIGRVRAVIHPDDREAYEAAAAGLDLLPPVHGGETRQESVLLGLESLEALAPERVLIHDAARPLVPAGLIDRVLGGLDRAPAVVPALPVVDTLKRAESGRVTATIDRTGLHRAQTPQGFRFRPILEAHRTFTHVTVTDDGAMAEVAGLAVRLAEGAEETMKITTGDDLLRVEALIAPPLPATGHGLDVHRFGPGDRVRLCGIDVPHDRALLGHSDADVALHALTDALLGAVAAGDIGTHFPPGDERWRGADSARFVAHALDLLRAARGRLVHADLTLLCERPRIGPHRDAMVARLAELLGLPASRIGLKATTTEGLGFLGRGEGIAAQATATVLLPDLR